MKMFDVTILIYIHEFRSKISLSKSTEHLGQGEDWGVMHNPDKVFGIEIKSFEPKVLVKHIKYNFL